MGNTLDLSGLPKRSRNNIQVALEKQVLIVSLGATELGENMIHLYTGEGKGKTPAAIESGKITT